MFNQNDAQRHLGGDDATVTFTSANKTATNPAKCKNIYLDRAAARIDAPNAANATKITTGEGDNAPATKNLDLVKDIAYQNYAVSNLNTKTNVMQKWESEHTKFMAPIGNYFLDYNTYGDKYNNNGSLVNFGSATSTYILENSTATLKMLQHCISATRQTLPLHQKRISRMVHSIVMMARSILPSSRSMMTLL